MGKFGTIPQANGRGEQLLYSIFTESDWSRDWFTLPDLKAIVAPPKWKMAIVSFIAAYSISSVAHYILSIYLGQRPLLINLFMT